MRLLIRFLRRLLIFGLGVFGVWLIVFVFEIVDRRLPSILALALTYAFAAYVFMPRAIRTGLKILQRQRVPSFTITGDGLPGDPVNVVLIGTLPQLREAFAAAGCMAQHDGIGRGIETDFMRAGMRAGAIGADVDGPRVAGFFHFLDQFQ